MLKPLAASALCVLASCSSEPARQPTAPPPPSCQGTSFEGVSFTHCVAVPGRHGIRTVVGPKGGQPYRSLSQLAVDRPDRSAPVAFAMNGGMFDAEGGPIGYYVEDGEKGKSLNTNEGFGNFHLLPNGVFLETPTASGRSAPAPTSSNRCTTGRTSAPSRAPCW
ncbi:hypothetical protein [Novosphingobium panipatense]|uniref:hypothetical protein n=1 Tax=Novosphingobium panipatense TaxID=428991 RepID=UPI00360C1E84